MNALYCEAKLDLTDSLFFVIQWAYSDFTGIAPSAKASNEFIINVKKGNTSILFLARSQCINT